MKTLEISQFFEKYYPSDLAYEWDNVGLQIGNLDQDVTGILITLDLTLDVVKEAIKNGFNTIVTHHPVLFKAIKTIDQTTYLGKMITLLIKHDITVFTAHTNYDIGDAGMNKVLADKLELTNQTPLEMVNETHGIGVIGSIKKQPLSDCVTSIKEKLGMKHARLIATNLNKPIETIAVLGGSGASYMDSAITKNVDLYITGDVSYHQALDMLHLDLTTLDVGHFAEHHFMDALEEAFVDYGFNVPIKTTKVINDPFKFV